MWELEVQWGKDQRLYNEAEHGINIYVSQVGPTDETLKHTDERSYVIDFRKS